MEAVGRLLEELGKYREFLNLQGEVNAILGKRVSLNIGGHVNVKPTDNAEIQCSDVVRELVKYTDFDSTAYEFCELVKPGESCVVEEASLVGGRLRIEVDCPEYEASVTFTLRNLRLIDLVFLAEIEEETKLLTLILGKLAEGQDRASQLLGILRKIDGLLNELSTGGHKPEAG